MEDNTREEGDEDGKSHPPFSGKIKKSEINRVQSSACDSDSGECHCKSSHTREGLRRKSWSGSNIQKGNPRKLPQFLALPPKLVSMTRNMEKMRKRKGRELKQSIQSYLPF